MIYFKTKNSFLFIALFILKCIFHLQDFLNTVRDKYRHLFEVSTDIIKRYCSLLEARKYVGLYYENSLQELENFKKKSVSLFCYQIMTFEILDDRLIPKCFTPSIQGVTLIFTRVQWLNHCTLEWVDFSWVGLSSRATKFSNVWVNKALGWLFWSTQWKKNGKISKYQLKDFSVTNIQSAWKSINKIAISRSKLTYFSLSVKINRRLTYLLKHFEIKCFSLNSKSSNSRLNPS